MKLSRFLYTLLLVSSIGCLTSRASAQDTNRLPPELDQNSSLSEIVHWLDKTSFANARVRLKDNWETDIPRVLWMQDDPPNETLLLTQGFRLTNLDGHYTKDPEKTRLLGAWQTEFKYEGPFSRTIVRLAIFSADSKPGRWEGVNLAFIFESKEMSEKFDAAFRRGIKLCQPK